jgi:hypothetical protein
MEAPFVDALIELEAFILNQAILNPNFVICSIIDQIKAYLQLLFVKQMPHLKKKISALILLLITCNIYLIKFRPQSLLRP